MQFSIIVPVYNAEQYIHECVNSIINQTYTHWECILINDGSKDNSAAICDRFAQADHRIKVLHKKNGGVSSARNLGVRHAQNDWLVFVDSDDCIAEDYLSELAKADNECDLIITGHTEDTEKASVQRPFVSHNQKVSQNDIPDFLSGKLAQLPIVAPWAKAFKKQIIQDNDLHFNEQMKLGEDCVFSFSYLLHINTIYAVSTPLYHYRISTKENPYAMNHENVIIHLNAISTAYSTLCQKWQCKSSTYNTFHAFCFLRTYCQYLNKNDVWKTEPYKNIVDTVNHPFIVSGLFSSDKMIDKKKILAGVYKVCDKMHLLKHFLFLLSRFYLK